MKLVDYAKHLGVTYRTAWNWFKAGKLPNAYQLPTGTIIVDTKEATTEVCKVAIYARVSSSENKSNLESQAQRLLDYCAARGYKVESIVKETASGLNDKRPKLLRLLTDPTITVIVVEHKDRLTRFGFNYIEQLLKLQNRSVEVINVEQDSRDDLMQDFVAVITSFCARLYGQRRCKRKTEKLIQEIQNDTN